MLGASLKRFWYKYGPNPFDQLLEVAQKNDQKSFLICWNRGLGDIALGIYALVYRIRSFIPDAQISLITRTDLYEGFQLLDRVDVFCDPDWKRGSPFDLDVSLGKFSFKRSDFDVVLENPNPTKWLMWQLGELVPQLYWKESWDLLCEKYAIDLQRPCLGVHVQTETNYSYEKNWPIDYWKRLFEKLMQEKGMQIVLFGFAPQPVFEGEGIVDLRGKTSLLEMLSIIKNRCDYLVVPDSGVLSLTYYLNHSFPLKIISLWADPKQGIMKQNVSSPNAELIHQPLIAPKRDLRHLSVEQVFQAMFS